MLSEREVSTSIGSTAYGANGDKLGTVEHFYVDDRTGAPTWVAVTTGLFGTRHSIVPAVDATFEESAGLRVPVTADAVKSAPHLTGDHLTPEDEAELRRHYGVGAGGRRTTADRRRSTSRAPGAVRPARRRSADPAGRPAGPRGGPRPAADATTAGWSAARNASSSAPSGWPPPGRGSSSTW